MAKRIEFDFQNEHYILEFSRRTVQELENSKFDINKLQSQPVTYLPMLFRGAFLMHHRKVKEEKINEIFKCLPDKMELVEKLIVLYYEPLNTLMEEKENDEGNALSWTANW